MVPGTCHVQQIITCLSLSQHILTLDTGIPTLSYLVMNTVQKYQYSKPASCLLIIRMNLICIHIVWIAEQKTGYMYNNYVCANDSLVLYRRAMKLSDANETTCSYTNHDGLKHSHICILQITEDCCILKISIWKQCW